MGAAAAIAIGVFRLSGATGEGMSLGATTSLIATGPMLDWTLRHASGGWRLYALFAAAGLASNFLALIVRGGSKIVLQGWDVFSLWMQRAAISYIACGILAGLFSGGIWFYARPKGTPLSEESR
jgi:hypothetical protein